MNPRQQSGYEREKTKSGTARSWKEGCQSFQKRIWPRGLIRPALLILLMSLASGCRLLPFAFEGPDDMGPGPSLDEAGPVTQGESECLPPSLAGSEQGPLELLLVHRDRVIPVRPGQEIVIHSPRFALLFNMADYDRYCHRFVAARVMASTNADKLENAIQPPFQIGDTTIMGPGWGMAPDLSLRYDTLMLTDEGMHYLVFDADGGPGDQRLSIQKFLTPGIYQFRWDIFGVASVGENSVEMLPAQKPLAFTMLFFRDADLDDIVETGEFMVFYIRIEPN
ncbi:MAG: hypothetical protein KDK23_09510 [Leptospiraceae bacterium]|nr:hypothetical protein [Leptospiraceae bacterium]